MFKLIVFVVSVVAINCVASFLENGTINRHARQASTCGVPKKHGTGLIIGGQNLERSWPWMVALLTKSSGKFFCGGTLISKTKVVTAAHCILEKSTIEAKLARDVLQVFAAYNLTNIHESGTFQQSPKRISVHPDWHPDTASFDADIAILVNEDEIPMTRLIMPICIWSSSTDPGVNEGIVAGWGIDSNDANRHSPIPKQIKVPIHDNADCLYGNPLLAGLMSPRTLCAGSRDQTGPCLGDSGSGMVFEKNGIYYFRAIVSSAILRKNQGCDLSNYAVYTDVLKYKNWMEVLPFRWVPWTSKLQSVPQGAVIGGNEFDNLYYVIKAKTEFGELPGKFAIGLGAHAHVSNGNVEYHIENFEILVGSNYIWSNAADDGNPKITTGKTAAGNDLYSCRAWLGKNLTPGKLDGDSCTISYAYVTYELKEWDGTLKAIA